jgi:hypothetical protein
MIVTVACFIRRRWSGFPCKDLAFVFKFVLIAVKGRGRVGSIGYRAAVSGPINEEWAGARDCNQPNGMDLLGFPGQIPRNNV